MGRPLVICCSQRFKKELEDLVTFLQKKGVMVFYPNFRRHRQEMIKKDEDKRLESDSYKNKIAGLVWAHLDNLQKSENIDGVCLIFNPLTKGRLNKKHGYIGKNTTLEMGYATRGGLLILMIKPDNDECTNVVSHHEDKKRIFALSFPEANPLDYEFLYENWLRHWLGTPSSTPSPAPSAK